MGVIFCRWNESCRAWCLRNSPGNLAEAGRIVKDRIRWFSLSISLLIFSATLPWHSQSQTLGSRFQQWFFVSYFDLRPFVKTEVGGSQLGSTRHQHDSNLQHLGGVGPNRLPIALAPQQLGRGGNTETHHSKSTRWPGWPEKSVMEPSGAVMSYEPMMSWGVCVRHPLHCFNLLHKLCQCNHLSLLGERRVSPTWFLIELSRQMNERTQCHKSFT